MGVRAGTRGVWRAEKDCAVVGVGSGNVSNWNTMKKAAQRGCAASMGFDVKLAIPAENSQLPIGHFLGHVKNQFAIFFVGLAQ